MATIFDCTVGIKKNNSQIEQDWMRLDENWTKSSFILDGTLKIYEFMGCLEKCSVSLKFCPALTQNKITCTINSAHESSIKQKYGVRPT
jgi:hypothetical protein